MFILVLEANSCKNVMLREVVGGTLRGAIAYFLETRSSQMNVEAADDVDAKY